MMLLPIYLFFTNRYLTFVEGSVQERIIKQQTAPLGPALRLSSNHKFTARGHPQTWRGKETCALGLQSKQTVNITKIHKCTANTVNPK